jgi:FkbH-like protein
MSTAAETSERATSVRRRLAGLDETPTSYLEAARELELRSADDLGFRELRISFLATFTVDVLVPYVAVEGARRSLAVRSTVAPFGQIEQQLLDPGSLVYRSNPDFVVIAARVEDAAPALVHDFVRLSAQDIERELGSFVARLENAVRAVRHRSRAQVLVWNQVLPMSLAAGLADAALEPSQTETVVDFNRRVSRMCRSIPGAYVFDVCRVASEVGLGAWQDSKLLYLARIPLSAAALIATAKRLARYLNALTTPPRKCLVLDLDNTLWGGVLGEDGAGGVALGEEYPGSVFKAFHRQLKGYRHRGILLAIASKNDEREVIDLFEHHPDCILRWGDFAARQVHWNDKAASLAKIADELKISVDALAYFDDSPVERESVRMRVPGVQVIEVPSDALRYGAAIEESGAFDHLDLTEEDRRRAELYCADRERRDLAESITSVEEFLRSLKMRVTIGVVDGATLPRVTQLVAKTNQFNLTTRRHTQAEIERMISEEAIALWMRLEDRFGDNGLVGVAIALGAPGRDVCLDTFLVSCRVLGRHAESALLRAVADRAGARGARRLLGEYVPSKKNGIAAGFLASCGFTSVPGRAGWWQLDLSAGRPPSPGWFEVVECT